MRTTTSKTLVRAGLYVVVGAVVVSTALGFGGDRGLDNVANGVLILGLVLGIGLLLSGAVARFLPGRRRR